MAGHVGGDASRDRLADVLVLQDVTSKERLSKPKRPSRELDYAQKLPDFHQLPVERDPYSRLGCNPKVGGFIPVAS